MALEAINEIKKAEDEAIRIVADAQGTAEELIKMAKEQENAADAELEDFIKKEHTKAVLAAKEKAEDNRRDAISNAKNQAKAEADDILLKKETAVKKVIEYILS